MVALKKPSPVPTEIVVDPAIMGGAPTVGGTRIQASTILAYLRAGSSDRDIFEDYPSLPLDGIDAVRRWAVESFGKDWAKSGTSFF